MKITVLATLMVFLAYFLVLYGGVGFIQDKRFFTSAPKENLDAIPDKKNGFPARICSAITSGHISGTLRSTFPPPLRRRGCVRCFEDV